MSSENPGFAVDGTYGCVYLSAIFTTALWGVGCIQAYLYFAKYWNRDELWFKAYILLLWIFDTAQEILVVHFNYMYFVKGIVDQSMLKQLPRTLINNALLTAFIDALVQLIFVRRAWIISKRNIALTVMLCLVVLAQFAVTAVYYGQIYNFQLLEQLASVRAMEITLNCTVVFADSFLATVLIGLLWKCRSGFKRTDSIIIRLVVYTVGSGLITALWAAVALIGVIAAPKSLVYLISDMAYPQLYFNCMLTSLIVRSSLRASQTSDKSRTNINLADLSSNPTRRPIVSADATNKESLPKVIECRVDLDVETGSER